MNPEQFLSALVTADGSSSKVESLPGAAVRRLVVKRTCELRPLLNQVATLSRHEQSAFIKSLALYEQTVGGLGSATLLLRALPLVDDPNHELFDWVLTNTKSYDYFARGVKSFEALESIKAASRARSAANLEREKERESAASVRRAKQATIKLVGAVKRGDSKAVEALLRQGARTDALNGDGVAIADYAEQLGRVEIANLIREWPESP